MQEDLDHRVPTVSDSTIVSQSPGEKPGSTIAAALLGNRTEVESEAPYFVGEMIPSSQPRLRLASCLPNAV